MNRDVVVIFSQGWKLNVFNFARVPAYNQIISLPMFPLMSDRDVEDVINAVDKVVQECL